MRRWYARRGIAWIPLLACCALALAAAVAGRRWPDTVAGLLPAVLAVCAAAAGFVYDESATAVVAVTPRGAGWRRTTRAAAALLPAAVFLVVVASLPGDVGLDLPAWLLAGSATVLLATGAAGLASRAGVGSPGPTVAAVVVLGLLATYLLAQFIGWTPLPAGDFPGSAVGFWWVLAGAGVATCCWAMRPGVPHS
jgi:hypothetical protein